MDSGAKRQGMDRATKSAVMILATAAVVAGLYFARGPLTQFTLAMILFLGIGGFARWLRRRTRAPAWLATLAGFVVVLTLIGLAGLIVAQNVGAFIEKFESYRANLNELIAAAHRALQLSGPPPTVATLAERFSLDSVAGEILSGVQGLLGDLTFVLIYLGFIYASSSEFPNKLDRIFQSDRGQRRARATLSAIRRSMERYLWTQTVISLLISVLTFGTLVLIGFDGRTALFLAFVIFFLNYIPTVGSLIATVLPTVLALVVFPGDFVRLALTALGVGVWQFAIGNFIQPRLLGESLNLSALVVLLALALWGLVWGIAGAFLSAPLTVMIMILLAQFPSTRWIAILLSADGKPDVAASRARAAAVADRT